MKNQNTSKEDKKVSYSFSSDNKATIFVKTGYGTNKVEAILFSPKAVEEIKRERSVYR